MCMISAAIPIGIVGRLFRRWTTRVHVSGTKIFTRLEGARQAVVYSMQLSSRSDAVMVLPVPVHRGFTPAEEAMEFVALGDYDRFFEDVESAFPPLFHPQPLRAESKGFGLSMPRPQLVVHKVGAYDASFVPSIRDFDRLDARLRLPDAVWDELPDYADYGFAVFKLRKGKRNRVHPMAFWFHTREPDSLFFPTVHVHDRKVHAKAKFDHALYFQLPAGCEARETITANGDELAIRSAESSGANVDLQRARGLYAPDGTVCELRVYGTRTNADYRVPVSAPRATGLAA